MPNTLAHLGVHAALTRGLIRGADFGWVWLGCVIPDLPWILQRVVMALPLGVSPYDMRFYAAVQSSLPFCLCAAIVAASVASRAPRALSILSLGCLIHLLLDASQTKWGNGVLLAPPLDWRLLNFGFYWPEDWPTAALSLLGTVSVVWAFRSMPPAPIRLVRLTSARCVTLVGSALLYAVGPLALTPAAERADLHFGGTLLEADERPGKPIAFDRAGIVRDGMNHVHLSTWTGETFETSGLAIPPAAKSVSLEGVFVDYKTIRIEALHVHEEGRRDLLTFVGLGVAALWWGISIRRGLRLATTPER